MKLDEEDKYDYAEHLILEHATDVEYLTVFEAATEYFGIPDDDELSEEDGRAVDDLLSKAVITVTFPDDPRPGPAPEVYRLATKDGELIQKPAYYSQVKRFYETPGNARRALQFAPTGAKVQAGRVEWTDI
jgi:hypothetical protein